MDKFLSMMFGDDFFEYFIDVKKICYVYEDFKLIFVYNREEWNSEYYYMIFNFSVIINEEKGELGKYLLVLKFLGRVFVVYNIRVEEKFCYVIIKVSFCDNWFN